MNYAKLVSACAVVFLCAAAAAAGRLDPIERVGIDDNRAILVNGEAFFPIMIWLQDPENFDSARKAGINTVAGYWSGSGGTKDVVEYLSAVEEAGFYGVMPFEKRLEGNSALLGYIHGDEPDLPHLVSDVEVVPSEALRINKSTPLWRIFDGVTHSWSVLDPMEGAEFTLKLQEPVEVTSLGVWLTVSRGLAVAKEIAFLAGCEEIARAKLEKKKSKQEIELAAPVRFSELTFRVESAYPGENVWGSISEIAGYDSDGENVLVSPPRNEPRTVASKVQEEYRRIKEVDSSRPIFMTLTGHFLPVFDKWSDEQRTALYPEYIKAADVVGYDIYPIYGWNKPEWLHLVHDGTEELRRLAGDRPVYAWIETSRGGQYTGALERQKRVLGRHIRAEVWMAICRGATAIGYFTHVWKPEYKQFGVPPENVKAMRQINDQIGRLAPAILSGPCGISAKVELEDGLKADIMVREYEGRVYLFAVNYDSRQEAARGRIEVEGLEAGAKIEVVDEGRSIRAVDGGFDDEFGPLGVHIYRIASLQ